MCTYRKVFQKQQKPKIITNFIISDNIEFVNNNDTVISLIAKTSGAIIQTLVHFGGSSASFTGHVASTVQHILIRFMIGIQVNLERLT